MKLILFDFDGVIVDTEQERFKKLQNLAKNEGIIISDNFFANIVGKKTTAFLRELNINKNIIEKIYRELQQNVSVPPLILGADKTIKKLSHNYRLAIVTGSKKVIVNKILEYYKLKEHFSFIISGENFTSSKPDPECYNLAVKKAQMPSSEMLVIEDSKAGIISAKKAGLIVWALKTKYNQNQISSANKIINSYKELNKLLTK
jgi:beta-phosphoglucomutase